QHGERLVMVLEYVDGMPLSKLGTGLRSIGHALDDRAAIYVATRIFAALAAAHTARNLETAEFAPVIHRDVNPSNVLIPWDGHAGSASARLAPARCRRRSPRGAEARARARTRQAQHHVRRNVHGAAHDGLFRRRPHAPQRSARARQTCIGRADGRHEWSPER